MTRALNQNWISFDGEPITGQMAPSVTVYGKTPATLTPEQQGGVAHAYKLFCQIKKTSVGQYQVQTRVLRDGTRVRMTSNSGIDNVYVWPPGGDREALDPNGYIIFPTDKEELLGWNTDILGNPITADAHITANEVFPVPPRFTLHTKFQAGPVSWISTGGQVLTYDHGGNNRYLTKLWETLNEVDPDDYLVGKRNIYYRGTTIVTPAEVDAAAIIGGVLIFVCRNEIWAAVSPLAGIDGALAQGDFRREITPTFTQVVPTGSVGAARRVSSWHFKPDGSRAACAVVYDTVDYSTWSWARMMREAVPQAKRYLDITVNPLTSQVSAVFSDAAFAGVAVGPRINGDPVGYRYNVVQGNGNRYPRDRPSNGEGAVVGDDLVPVDSGTLTFQGKRLWGVDFAEDGTELLVTFQLAGTGSVSRTRDVNNTAVSGSFSMASTWGVYINDVALIEAASAFAASGGNTSTSGTADCNYLSIHDMDARFKAVIAERLRRTPGSATATIDHIFNGALVFQDVQTFPAAAAPTAAFSVFPTEWEPHANNGPFWYMSNGAFTSVRAWKCPLWPQTPGWDGENTFEHERSQYLDGEFPRMSSQHLRGYPNEVTNALMGGCTDHANTELAGFIFFCEFDEDRTGPAIGGPTINGAPGETNYFGKPGLASLVDLSWWPNIYPGMFLDYVEEGDGGSSVFGPARSVKGFARRDYASDHYLVATKNTYCRGFYNTFMRFRQLTANEVETPIDPVMTLSAFVRPEPTVLDPDPAYSRVDLLTTLADKIDGEVGSGTVNRPTLRTDPVRVV